MKYNEQTIENLNKNIAEVFTHLEPITSDMKLSFEGVARMVMLDRYSQKDVSLETLAPGDLVIANIKPDPKFPTQCLAIVKDSTSRNVTIEVFEEYVALIDPKLNPKGALVELKLSEITKPLEVYFEQIATRVAKALNKNESKAFIKKAAKQIQDRSIVPAGRVLYGAGSNSMVTFFNCYVMPYIEDSREGISKHRTQVAEIMARGGGVGTNGSTLRPKDAIAKSVGGLSSGSVSWLNDLSQLTNLIQQGGSRRGAQMIMLGVWHPDIIEFIISKIQNPKILEAIITRFKDKDIIRAAKNKLILQPLDSLSRSRHETIVKMKEFVADDVYEESKSIIDQGGLFTVENPEFLSGANISVAITNDFMAAIKANEQFELRFPDLAKMTPKQKEVYDKHWATIGDVNEWSRKGYPTKVYRKVWAKELWDLINFCATYSAEPGIFFIDRANEMTNAKSYGQKVVATNPCGEQPLAPYSVCNLAAINLANFVDKKAKKVLWNELKETVAIQVRLQDNVIDSTPYFLKENEDQALGERRVGMGIMGLHDMLIWLGVRYGSKEGNVIVDKVFEEIARTAYKTSADIGAEKGMFPFMKSLDRLMDTGYIKKLPKDVRDYIREKGGLRNSHLLTVAPTGSTGTMVGVSTGLEPYFAFKYYRSGRLGNMLEMDQKIVAEWKELNNFKGDKLPDFFTTAMELSPEEHADVQCIIQRWVDSSISKTVNAPKGFKISDVEKIYMRLFDKGAKGGTVYVDGSRNAQVLTLALEEEEQTAKKEYVVSPGDMIKMKKKKEARKGQPGDKQDKKFGTGDGDICVICKEGTMVDQGGCITCANCGAQLKCGL